MGIGYFQITYEQKKKERIKGKQKRRNKKENWKKKSKINSNENAKYQKFYNATNTGLGTLRKI